MTDYVISEDELEQLVLRFIYHDMEYSAPVVFKARTEFINTIRSHLLTEALKAEKERMLNSQHINDLEMQIECSEMLFNDYTPENIEMAYRELDAEVKKFLRFLRGDS